MKQPLRITHISQIAAQPQPDNQQLAISNVIARLHAVELERIRLQQLYNQALVYQERAAKQMEILIAGLSEIRELQGVNVHGMNATAIAASTLYHSAILIN